LDDRDSIPGRGRDSSLRHLVQTGFGTHSSSYTMGGGDTFSRVNRPDREADHSPLSSAGIKNAWSYTSTPSYVFMAWCSIKHSDKFTFMSIIFGSTE